VRERLPWVRWGPVRNGMAEIEQLAPEVLREFSTRRRQIEERERELVAAQVLNGFITPCLLTYVLILANRKSVLGAVANGPKFRVLATLCVGVVALLSATVLVQTVAGWF
jgi:hypothetical protein